MEKNKMTKDKKEMKK